MDCIKIIIDFFVAIGTLALAWLAYLSLKRDSERELHRNTPWITFDFYDVGDHENLGLPGFRNISSNPEHPALRLGGALRNLSTTPAIDCQFDIYYRSESQVKPIHEISGIRLSNGLGSGERVEIAKTITIHDIDTHGSKYFVVGIAGLFNGFGVPPGSEYPFDVVFSCKNTFGNPFFSVYTMKMDGIIPGKAKPSMVFKGSRAGTFPKDWTTDRSLSKGAPE